MLQNGPITKLYTGGGGKFVPSHEGYSLRMPAEEISQWQTVDEKGEVQDILRPVHAVRVWDAGARLYKCVDATLDGAPTTPGETDEWFVGAIRKLKASHPQGSELLNRLVTSTSTADASALERCDFDAAFTGQFNNRWTELVLKTSVQ